MGDADDSYDFDHLDSFLARLRAGADLVVGNRFRGGIARGAMPALHYYLGNPILSLLGKIFFKIPISDFHCGLRGFRRDAIEALNLKSSGMEFASEMIVRSALKGLSIEEVPTTLRPDGRGRPPHLRTWRDGWRHLKFLLTLSPKWLYFYPGAAFLCVGLFLVALLATGPFKISAHVVLDLNTFLAGCGMVIIGVQLVTMGAFARSFATVAGILPSSPRSEAISSRVRTDSLARCAAIILSTGAAIFVAALIQWQRANFGDLDSPFVPRAVVGGLSLMVVGIQMGFTAFLFEIIEIEIKNRSAGPLRNEP
jgi:hypothetical protein